jgi:hypothetical protein
MQTDVTTEQIEVIRQIWLFWGLLLILAVVIIFIELLKYILQ